MPSAQTALDIFKGAWKSKLPGNLSSGDQERFADTRVQWFMKTADLGTLEGQRILELGPFEAYNTHQFCKFGATDVTAIEGNTINFLKCLVVKEVLGFGARFLCGDFLEYLRASSRPYDLVWASGVLYHQTKPLELLRLAMRNGRHVFVWTHYYDESILSTDHAPEFDRARNVSVRLGDASIELICRSYLIDEYAKIPLYYESGSRTYAYWMRKQDILKAFELEGFRTRIMIDTELDRLPVIAFLATREDGRG
jgi:hypothetical protein